MSNASIRALLPAAALLALGGCAGNLPERSTAAVPSSQIASPATVISPAATVTTTSVTTTSPTVSGAPFAPPGTVTYYSPAGYPPQVASTVQTVSVLPAQLNGSEILMLLTNNTASGVAGNGQPYYLYFMQDGRARFREPNFADAGSWRVLGDRLCTSMTKTNVGVEQCYTLYRDGSNVAFERDGVRLGTFTVLAGDPRNL